MAPDDQIILTSLCTNVNEILQEIQKNEEMKRAQDYQALSNQ